MFGANRVTDLVTGNREQWTWPTIELQKYLQETEDQRANWLPIGNKCSLMASDIFPKS